jgi:hypothetical protein
MMLKSARLRPWRWILPPGMRSRLKLRLSTTLVSRRDKARFRGSLRPNDVFLVGHPRSGNTWLAYMLAILLERGDPAGRVTVANIGHFVPVIHGRDPMIADHEALVDPRIFRNERPSYPDLYPRALFVVRDPRSTLVSFYHYYKTLTNDEGMTLDAFVATYLKDGCIRSFEPGVRWDQLITQWVERARQRPVMIVKYEELHRDTKGVLEEVARFCMIPASAGAMASALERAGFQAMQRAEIQHGVEPQHPPDPPSRGWFFRSGRTDAWKAELSVTALSAIENTFRPVMATLGYATSS